MTVMTEAEFQGGEEEDDEEEEDVSLTCLCDPMLCCSKKQLT